MMISAVAESEEERNLSFSNSECLLLYYGLESLIHRYENAIGSPVFSPETKRECMRRIGIAREAQQKLEVNDV